MLLLWHITVHRAARAQQLVFQSHYHGPLSVFLNLFIVVLLFKLMELCM